MWPWLDKISVGSAIFICIISALKLCDINSWKIEYIPFFICGMNEKNVYLLLYKLQELPCKNIQFFRMTSKLSKLAEYEEL